MKLGTMQMETKLIIKKSITISKKAPQVPQGSSSNQYNYKNLQLWQVFNIQLFNFQPSQVSQGYFHIAMAEYLL